MDKLQSIHRIRVLFITFGIAIMCVCSLSLLLNLTSASASDEVQSTPPSDFATDCTNKSQVPITECLALVELYTSTAGTQWINQSNWLVFDSNAPCNWAGVVCNNGQVSGLLLASNQLSGSLPLSIGNLSALTQLQLQSNRLRGRIPPSLCRLRTTLTDANLAYNALYTKLRTVERCMSQIDPDWRLTQTVPPSDLHISTITTDSIRLTWKPISYTNDSGYYEIGIKSSLTGTFELHGKTSDKNASNYVIDGLKPGRPYQIALRTVTEPHAQQTNTLSSVPIAEVAATQSLSGSVLLMAYFPADNDLASEIEYVVERYRAGSERNPNVKVLMLVDGRQANDTTIMLLESGVLSRTNIVSQEWGINELDTADPIVLNWFLTYGRSHYPAQRTIVALMGHGIPPSPEIEFPLPLQVSSSTAHGLGIFPALPKGHDYTPSDITNNGYMSTVDLGQALMAATQNGANPFDVVFFDQCFQGSLDTLYEVHKSAKVFVASPNYAWLVASYHRYLAYLLPDATPEFMSGAIVAIYQETLDRNHPNTIFAIRGNQVPIIADAVNTLADRLKVATEAGEQSRIANAVKQSKYVDTTQCGSEKLELGPPDALIGIDTFVANLQNEFVSNDIYGVHAASVVVDNTLSQIPKLSITGSPYLAPDEIWDYRDSLTLVAPLPRNSPSRIAWRASLYTSTVPFTATWTVLPNDPVTITASLKYAQEGRWDDFLSTWYQELEPTLGAWCHYTPPQQVLLDDAEVLSLTAVALGIDGVRLEWTPTDDSEATQYWIMSRRPRDVSWRVADVLSLDSTTISVSELITGTHHFRVLARNSSQDFVAVSKDTSVLLLEEEEMNSLFLPLINRE